MNSFLHELKNLHFKYLGSDKPLKSFEKDYESVSSQNPDFIYISSLRESEDIHLTEEETKYLDSLYSYFDSENQHTLAEEIDPDSFGTDGQEFQGDPSEDSEADLGASEDSFINKYPEVDTDALLREVYDNWISTVKGKPFFKTIQGFYDTYSLGELNFLDRRFLWKFIKAISSCLTHLLIEGENEVALVFIEKYYDSLVQCLNSVVHADDKEDVVTSFQFMVEFLGISNEDTSNDE